jgi:predicted phage terminase large subunit-like protein
MLELNESIRRRLTPRFPAGGLVPHRPHPKQAAFLLLPHREVLFGGAAGGGKSDALLMAALQYVDVPGYAALILRATYSSLTLPDGLIPRAMSWLSPAIKAGRVKWNGETHTFTFKTGGKPATLTFGHLEQERHRYRYASSAYQFIGFEELTEFKEESDYTFMSSRLRRTTDMAAIPLRLRATTNPIGRGYEWVKKRFVTPTNDAKRFFLPSTLRDNPSLDEAAYRESLAVLPPIIRQKLEEGDWTVVRAGDVFPKTRWQYIEAGRITERIDLIGRGWDFAASEPSHDYPDPDWTVGVKMGIGNTSGRVYVFGVERDRVGPEDVQAMFVSCAHRDGHDCYVRWERDGGQAGKAQDVAMLKLLPDARWDGKGIPSTKNKLYRAGPLSAQQRARNCYLVLTGDALRDAWVESYVAELHGFTGDDKGASKDDQVDGSSVIYNELQGLQPRTREVPYGPRLD